MRLGTAKNFHTQSVFFGYIHIALSFQRRYRSRSILALLDNGIFFTSAHDCSHEIHPREIRNFAAQKRERARGRKDEKRGSHCRSLMREVSAGPAQNPRTRIRLKKGRTDEANSLVVGERPTAYVGRPRPATFHSCGSSCQVFPLWPVRPSLPSLRHGLLFTRGRENRTRDVTRCCPTACKVKCSFSSAACYELVEKTLLI